jgi:hypothetical protein
MPLGGKVSLAFILEVPRKNFLATLQDLRRVSRDLAYGACPTERLETTRMCMINIDLH